MVLRALLVPPELPESQELKEFQVLLVREQYVLRGLPVPPELLESQELKEFQV